MISSDPPRMLFFISSSAIAPREVERTDVSAGRQGTDLCECSDNYEPCVNCLSDPSSDQEDDDENDEEDTS